MASMARTVTSNVAYGVAAQIIMKVASFAFSIFIVRHLGVEAYGQYMAVLAFGALFTFLADLGLSPFTVREVSRIRDAPAASAAIGRLFGNVLALRLLLGALASVLVVASAWLTNRPPLMVLAIALSTIGLIIYGVQGASDAILAGFERLDRSATAKIAYQVTFVLLGAAALGLRLSYFGLIYATLAAIAIMSILCWNGVLQLGVRPSKPSPGHWPSLLRSSLPFGLIGLTLGLSYKFDSVLLNVVRGNAETGYYNAAYSLVFSAVLLSNVINFSLFPSLARAAARRHQGLGEIYDRVLRYLLVIALPMTVGGAVMATQLIPLLFGADYTPAIGAFQIIIWALPLMFVSEFLGYILTIHGREHRLARALVFSTAFNVAVNLAVVPRWGLYGAAVVTVITELLLVVQYVWILRADLAVFDLRVSVLRPVAAALLMGGVALAFSSAGVPLFVTIGLSAIVYLATLLMLGSLGADELRFLRSLKQPDLSGGHSD